MTAQATFTSEKVRRTKFFFGVRYMWSKQQIAEPFSSIAAGVRCDVSPPPDWLKNEIEATLVQGTIIPKVLIFFHFFEKIKEIFQRISSIPSQ